MRPARHRCVRGFTNFAVTVAILASVALGVTFLVAGAAKVVSGPLWTVNARALGAPRVVIPAVPWLEIVIGALLCAQIARVPMALAAAALLVAFTALLLMRLVHGEHPVCSCFGTWRATPLGWRHVARNIALIGIALLVGVEGR